MRSPASLPRRRCPGLRRPRGRRRPGSLHGPSGSPPPKAAGAVLDPSVGPGAPTAHPRRGAGEGRPVPRGSPSSAESSASQHLGDERDGSRARRLTTSPGDGEPTWSPDGRRIVFRRSSATNSTCGSFPPRAAGPLVSCARPSRTSSTRTRSPTGGGSHFRARGGQIQTWVMSLSSKVARRPTRGAASFSGLGARWAPHRVHDRRPDRNCRLQHSPCADLAERDTEERRRPRMVPLTAGALRSSAEAGKRHARGRRRPPLSHARRLGHQRRARLVAPEPCRRGGVGMDMSGSRRRPDHTCTRLGSVSRSGRADHRAIEPGAVAGTAGRQDRDGGGPQRPEALCRSGDLPARRRRRATSLSRPAHGAGRTLPRQDHLPGRR